MKTTVDRLDAPGGRSAVRQNLLRRGAVPLAACGILLFAVAHSQVPQYNGGLPGPERSASGFAGLPENANPRPDGVRALRDSMQQQENLKRLKEMNIQRQKDMASDTAKLLQLANELKAETNTGEAEKLSMLDVRKAELIEKLAKNVRDKMKASVAQ